MPEAKLSIALPAETWIGGITRTHPQVNIRVLAALPTGETGVGLVELSGPAIEDALQAMRETEAVLSIDVLGETPDRTLLEFETDEPLLLFSGRESGVPIEPPVDIRDGVATVETTASIDRLSEFGTQLEQFGLRFNVEYVHQSVETTDRLLTDRQRELVTAAVEQGYYDTPRTCTLTELADHVGAAKSTISETLHRAEETIVKEFVTGPPQQSGADHVPIQ